MSKTTLHTEYGIVTIPDEDEESFQEWTASKLPTKVLVTSLYERGVSYEDIFGMYYALEAQMDAKHDEIFGNDEEGQHGTPRLTVGDAHLAGHDGKPTPKGDF